MSFVPLEECRKSTTQKQKIQTADRKNSTVSIVFEESPRKRDWGHVINEKKATDFVGQDEELLNKMLCDLLGHRKQIKSIQTACSEGKYKVSTYYKTHMLCVYFKY